MKIAAYLDHKVESGGNFQQSLNAALQMKRICEGSHEFSIYTPIKSNLNILQELGLKTVYCPHSLLDKVFSLAAYSAALWRVLSTFRILSSFEKKLKRDGVDLVYFLAQSGKASSLQSLNYIFTVFDLCHRDFPEFPEVRAFGAFERRELLFKSTLGKACLVVADSHELKHKLQLYFAVDPKRILVMPFQPAIECVANTNKETDEDVLSYYSLAPGYLFYPAHFWSHKNHVRILEALEIFEDRTGYIPSCVFTGADKGNLTIVSQMANRMRQNSSIRFLGFVPNEHISALYRSAAALVMPTYFGPTNLPPLEALALGIPIIYPSHLSDQLGNAAIYFDADDAVSLCEAIELVLLGNYDSQSLETRHNKFNQITSNVIGAEEELINFLNRFERRLSCWSIKRDFVRSI